MKFLVNKQLDKLLREGLDSNEDIKAFKTLSDTILNLGKSEREEAKLLKDLGLTESELEGILSDGEDQ